MFTSYRLCVLTLTVGRNGGERCVGIALDIRPSVKDVVDNEVEKMSKARNLKYTRNLPLLFHWRVGKC